MKTKHVNAAREARLWIGQVIVPAATLVATALTIPGVKEKAIGNVVKVKNAVGRKFKK